MYFQEKLGELTGIGTESSWQIVAKETTDWRDMNCTNKNTDRFSTDKEKYGQSKTCSKRNHYYIHERSSSCTPPPLTQCERARMG